MMPGHFFPSRYDRQWPGGRFRLPASGLYGLKKWEPAHNSFLDYPIGRMIHVPVYLGMAHHGAALSFPGSQGCMPVLRRDAYGFGVQERQRLFQGGIVRTRWCGDRRKENAQYQRLRNSCGLCGRQMKPRISSADGFPKGNTGIRGNLTPLLLKALTGFILRRGKCPHPQCR